MALTECSSLTQRPAPDAELSSAVCPRATTSAPNDTRSVIACKSNYKLLYILYVYRIEDITDLGQTLDLDVIKIFNQF